eukprot:m.59007 g.59007  ORF g.59007 m.59007 type:complete len:120 (+) comp17281_c0_seq1:308-667(+)
MLMSMRAFPVNSAGYRPRSGDPREDVSVRHYFTGSWKKKNPAKPNQIEFIKSSSTTKVVKMRVLGLREDAVVKPRASVGVHRNTSRAEHVNAAATEEGGPRHLPVANGQEKNTTRDRRS